LTTNGQGTVYWAAATTGTAGTTNTVTSVDQFTGDGVTTNFALSVTPGSLNQTIVNYNGVVQLHSAYAIVGNVIIFSQAPYAGSQIEVSTIQGAASTSGSYVTRTYTGDGTTRNFTVTSGTTVNSVLVVNAGAVMIPTTDYTVSGAVLTFAVAPALSANIQIRELVVLAATVTTDTLRPFLLMGA